MRYALVGCGRIAPRHLAAAQANHLDLVALCDLDLARAEALAPEGTPLYDDLPAMLWEAEPELVAVATDSGSHAAVALACLESGCHVLIEKPVALSLPDADAVIALAKKQGVVAAVCHQNRFNGAVLALAAALSERRLGRLLHGAAQVRWRRDAAYYAQAGWRGRWATDGGVLMNQCIHCIDLLRWAFGPVDEVSGRLARVCHPAIEAEDVGLATLRFHSGALGLIEGSSCVWPRNLSETLSVFGERGAVVLGGQSLERAETWRVDGLSQPEAERPPDIYGFGHVPLYADLLAAIETGRPPLVSAAEGRDALELVLAVYRSARENRPVRLPMGDFGSADMAGFWPATP